MAVMERFEFCQNFVYRKGRPIDFTGRDYLRAIYDSPAQRLVLRASRQVEKSTFLANAIAHAATTIPGITILFVAPRDQQAHIFVKSRLHPVLQDSPVLRRTLVGHRRQNLGIKDLLFKNRSMVHARAAFHSADAVRGLSADLLVVDELQDIAAGDLPVLQETLSHSELRWEVFAGTPKLVGNHLESVFQRSTACEWTVPCENCSRGVILDQRALGTAGLICHHCQLAIDPRRGAWVARHPHATWGSGFWINHPMAPWVQHTDILEKRRTYDPAKFKNECLGLPTTVGELVVTRDELEACCSSRPMAKSRQDVPAQAASRLVAGIDWGGGAAARTAIAIGYLRLDNVFEILHFAAFAANEDPTYLLEQVAQLCRQFDAQFIGSDGGGSGFHLNRLLAQSLRLPMYAILYGMSHQEPAQNGVLWDWNVHRTASIGNVFARVKSRKISFPRVEDCREFLDEFECERAEYDEHHRSIRYICADSKRDDILHATNYAHLMAVRPHMTNIYGVEMDY